MKALGLSCLAAALAGLAACSAGDAPSGGLLSENETPLEDQAPEESALEDETGTNANALRRGPGARRRPGGGRPPQDPCATVRCAAGTHCEAVGRRAICAPDDPEPVNPCAAILCIEGTVCEVIDGQGVCVGDAPPPEENPCALVDCPPERPVCEVRDGEGVCVAAAPFCGGIAGFACPGAGVCEDDPSDDCDPNAGGADCGGLCTCGNVLLLCIEGTVFDPSPEVCACVPEPEPVNPCAAVLCAPGTRCVARGDEAHCVPRGRECAHTR